MAFGMFSKIVCVSFEQSKDLFSINFFENKRNAILIAAFVTLSMAFSKALLSVTLSMAFSKALLTILVIFCKRIHALPVVTLLHELVPWSL